MQSKTASLRGLTLLALGCGLVAPARAQMTPVTAFGGAGVTGGAQFGYSVGVSFDGTVAIVGAPLFNASAGGVWVSSRTGASWTSGTPLTAGTGAAGAGQQGYAVAMSGDGLTAIVGAQYDAAGGGANAGAFWIYSSSGGIFSQQGSIHSGAVGNLLGTSVALSQDGNTAIAGAPGNNSVAVFVRSGASWSSQTTLAGSANSSFGTSVALSADGNTALVGAPDTSGQAGAAWVYTRSGTTWSTGTLLPLGTPSISFGRQGMAVSLSGNGQRALVGGFNTSLAGAAWVYNLLNGAWTQEAQLAFFSTSGTDSQGSAVALSPDGTFAIVGAPHYIGAEGAALQYLRSVNPTTQQVSWPFVGGVQGNAGGWLCGTSVAVASVSFNTGLYGCPGYPTTGEMVSLASPDLAIANVHNGAFSRGAGGSYTIQVSNVGQLATYSGQPVTVTDTLPAGLGYSTFSGSGWGCTSAAANPGTTVTCTNSNQISAGAAFADLVVNVTVSSSAPAALSAVATVSGGGEIDTANNSSVDLVTLPQLPDLVIKLSHTGSLYQGLTGVPYTIVVTNSSNMSSNGTVTVTDSLPVGLTNLSYAASQNGWSCSGAAVLTCTRGDALSANAAYPTISFTVDVSLTAPASLTNTATVAGGSDGNTANNTFKDFAAVGSKDNSMTVASSHIGNFKVGVTGIYYITVTNGESTPTSGTVTVTDTLPAGLTVQSMSGIGWSCSTLTCTRHDSLPAGLSYRVITLKVNVGSTGTLTNNVTVSGGGVPGGSGSDVTTVTN
jgi:uncharacterized repeat protein (TIGR01451 family)